MSQHYLNGRDPSVLVIVGFDPAPQQGFFGQVCRNGEIEETWPDFDKTFVSVKEITEHASRVVDIPAVVQERLVEDAVAYHRSRRIDPDDREQHIALRKIYNRVEDYRPREIERDGTHERPVSSEEREI
jgi:hypothetical protein